tara:strand:- start:41 stop:754 length:714 start_codon:yes stop_codon:yes gene_type:complete
MAGHSHWAGIKHKKGKADKIRSKIFSKISKEITVAAKLGDKNPNMNPRLRSAIQSARAANMPKDNIERAIEKSTSSNEVNFEQIRYEGFGPFKVACIVETLTDNKNRTASNLRSIFQKNGGSLGAQGSASFNFNQIGVIRFGMDEINEHEIYDYAIEIGVKEFYNKKEYFEVHCKKNELYEVKKKLENKIENFISTEIEWLPYNKVSLTNTDKIELNKFLDNLESDDDIQKIYTNME